VLYIEKALVDDLIAMAEPGNEECCGFLFGYGSLEDRIVTKTMMAENIAENRKDRFEISPLEYLNAERYADRNSLRLLGIYHSHVDHPAIPSESDRLSAYPELSYLIISVTNQKFKDIRSWRLNLSARFEEELISNRITN
jgi:proteasome lid subunit RPN8/RPN11